jgi:hypothetical protein
MRERTNQPLLGVCMYCNAELERRAMTKHLSACLVRRAAIEQAEQQNIPTEQLYHLFVEDAYEPLFWLHLEIRGSSTLKELDYYLRRIWLECCDHLSDFYIGSWQGRKLAKSRTISQSLRKGDQILHIYDYGSSSETLVKAVSVREGKPTTPHPIVLMARNKMPDYRCVECEQPAVWWCWECYAETGEMLCFCEACGRTHEHEYYGSGDEEFAPEWAMPLVNSPRVGLCGYTGPADPPY